MSFLNRPITGIDFGKKVVKLAHCALDNGNPVVKKASFIELPDDYAEDTYLDIALDSIVRNKKLHNIPLDNTAIICPRDLYASFNVSFPVMPKDELFSALQWEIKRVSNLEPEKVNFDYYPNIKKENETEYLVYYAEKEKINALTGKFKKYGITLRYIDVEDMVHLACFNALYTDDGTVKGFFDMGYSRSKIIIAKGGVLRFNREWDHNLRTIYDKLEKEYLKGTNYKEALEIRGFNDEIVSRILTEYLSELLYEISRSIDYFTANYKLSPPTNVFLSGGFFKIPGVFEFFQKNFAYSTTLNNVLDVAGYDDKNVSQAGFMFNLAVGAALR